jgi:hypothetical protein
MIENSEGGYVAKSDYAPIEPLAESRGWNPDGEQTAVEYLAAKLKTDLRVMWLLAQQIDAQSDPKHPCPNPEHCCDPMYIVEDAVRKASQEKDAVWGIESYERQTESMLEESLQNKLRTAEHEVSRLKREALEEAEYCENCSNYYLPSVMKLTEDEVALCPECFASCVDESRSELEDESQLDAEQSPKHDSLDGHCQDGCPCLIDAEQKGDAKK